VCTCVSVLCAEIDLLSPHLRTNMIHFVDRCRNLQERELFRRPGKLKCVLLQQGSLNLTVDYDY
jgi:hypothetical protein